MIRRNFLFGLAATGALAAGRRAAGAAASDSSLLKKGFAKTSLGAEAWFEVHGNPKGFDAIDGPYKLMLETTRKLQQESPDRHEIARKSILAANPRELARI